MAHCWEEYMWKVHKAVPLDPWATNVQLLDVFIQETSRLSPAWLPSWLHKQSTSKPASNLFRAGSLLSLATSTSCKPKPVVANESGVNGCGNNNAFTGSTDGDSAAQQPILNSTNGGSPPTHSQHLMKAESNATISSNDKNTSDGDTAPPAGPRSTHIVNRETPAQLQDMKQKVSHNSSTEQPIHRALLMKAFGMPDIQASIRSSTSWLGALMVGSSASAQFDVKGSKTVTCNVGGVESQHVDVDALMELVTPCSRKTSGHGHSGALWQPDISLPQLQWSSKWGQTLWVVTEIMYANLIKIEADKQAQGNSKAKVSKGAMAEASEQVEVEKEGVWNVRAAKDKSTFPFAFRLLRLDYDAGGCLIAAGCHNNLKRNNSLRIKTIAMKQGLSFKHLNALNRSSSVSH